MLEWTWNEYERQLDILVRFIQTKNNDFAGIYGIPRGGTIAACMLSHRLNIPLIVEVNKIKVNMILVDDIIDSGNTFAKFLGMLSNKNNWSSKEWTTMCTTSIILNTSSILEPAFFAFHNINNEWIKFPYENHPDEDSVSKVQKPEE